MDCDIGTLVSFYGCANSSVCTSSPNNTICCEGDYCNGPEGFVAPPPTKSEAIQKRLPTWALILTGLTALKTSTSPRCFSTSALLVIMILLTTLTLPAFSLQCYKKVSTTWSVETCSGSDDRCLGYGESVATGVFRFESF